MFSLWQSIGCTFPAREQQLPVFAQTLAQAKQGDAEAITALYRHFLPCVFGYIATRVPDRSTAEDLTSEVFLKMVEGIEHIRATEEASMAAWLFRVARITVAGYYRQRAKHPEMVSLTPEDGDGASWVQERATPLDQNPESDPVGHAEAREEWAVVVQAMNRLTEEQRQVLIGRLILGYDVATVARMMGKRANAVKALQFRALQSLQRLLAKETRSVMEQSIQQPPLPWEHMR